MSNNNRAKGKSTPTQNTRPHQAVQNRTEPIEGSIKGKIADKLWDANWWMVVLTALVGVVAVLQWSVAQSTLTIANRAYVTATATVFPVEVVEPGRGLIGPEKSPFRAGDIPHFQVKYTNTGVTPAIDVVGGMTSVLADRLPFEIRDAPLDTSNPPGSSQSHGTIAKEGFVNYRVNLGTRLTADQIDKVNKRQLFLAVFGMVEYRDVFNAIHRTESCFVYIPELLTMSHCPNGNKMN